jgi:branched-chain amino acid aminotransferase
MGVSFDDIDGVIWFDGKLVPWKEANVHVLTHGLHYASCVFEGERAYGGRAFRSTAHSQRALLVWPRKRGEVKRTPVAALRVGW